ncbi:MAG: HlyD family secretion protein [Deltaproteobacteria bacterium]|nr:HlyD family secretion protein [Deltaproteobacteria bacterium]
MAAEVVGTESEVKEAAVRWSAARIARIGVVLAALAGAGYYGLHELRAIWGTESTDDAFVEGHLVYVSPRVPGQVVEVLVGENQLVSAGDVLVRIDPADHEARVALAQANLELARNSIAHTGAASEAAAAQVRGAQARLQHGEQELVRARELAARGAASAHALDAAVATRDAAVAELRAAQRREDAERAMLGSSAPVKQAEAALREAELALSYTTIRAPFGGRVGKKSAELGATVQPGQPLLTIVATSGNWVVANFKETQIGAMKPGDPVEIAVDAFPDRAWRGHIESISPATGAKYALLPPDNATGNFTKVVQRVPVKIALDAVSGESAAGEDPTALPVGLSVVARVRPQ